MAWKKTDNLIRKRLNQHGLGGVFIATRTCEKARELYPGLFEPVSVRNGCMHISILAKNKLPFMMIQGKLMQDINRFAEGEKLPQIDRFRLTITTD